jgi:GDP-L-fucose synthase
MKNIVIFGSTGFIGNSFISKVNKKKFKIFSPKSKDLDLMKYNSVKRYFKTLPKIDLVINCAAKIGGLGYMMDFPDKIFLENYQIIGNLLKITKELDIQNYLAIGSACSYPDQSNIMKEENFWNGRINPNIEPYGFIKKFELVGLQALKLKNKNFNYYYPILANVYGPGDSFDINNSHVLGSLIRKFVEAKRKSINKVDVWGDGSSVRDFIYIEDVSKILNKIIFKKKYRNKIINITSGENITIKKLVEKIQNVIKFKFNIKWDKTRPNGVKFKALSSRNMATMKLKSVENLNRGIKKTIVWYEKFK